MFCPTGLSDTYYATTSASRLTLGAVDTETGVLRIRVSSPSVPVFILFGDNTVVATATDISIDTGFSEFKIPAGSTHFSVVTEASSVYVYYTVGQRV